MRTLKVVYPDVLDVGCFSHVLDLAGKQHQTWMSLPSIGSPSSPTVPKPKLPGRPPLAYQFVPALKLDGGPMVSDRTGAQFVWKH